MLGKKAKSKLINQNFSLKQEVSVIVGDNIVRMRDMHAF